MNQFTQDTQKILDTLKQVAAQPLDRKQRLGHYVVIWQDERAVAIGADAPTNSNPSPQADR